MGSPLGALAAEPREKRQWGALSNDHREEPLGCALAAEQREKSQWGALSRE